jgi:uncharacterized membrane protein
MTDSGLSFFPSGAALFVVPIALLMTGVLCWLAYQRSGYRRATGLLELLRFVLVGLVLATLCQPEWLESKRAEQRSTLAVLWDRSNSMQTKDVLDGAGSDPGSRAGAIESLLEEKAWRPATEPGSSAQPGSDFEVVFEPFSSTLDQPDEATDLNHGLSQVLDRYDNLRGVVVLSDGDWNVGQSPVEAAMRFKMLGVPVFAVGVGSRVPLPDLALVRMDAPTFGVRGKPLRIPFVVKNQLGQSRDVRVSLLIDGKPARSLTVRVPAMEEVQRNLVWTPTAIGDFELTLRIPQDPMERVPDNNVLDAKIAVREEQLKVLVIESRPRWEYRYLRNALERDPGVEVTCLLYHPGLPKVGGGRTYIERFPSASELSRFDVVFLGDVGISGGAGNKQLTVAQARELRQLVSAQAAGLVFLPGRYGLQATLAGSPLGDLLPVIVDDARPLGIGTSKPGHFALTTTGQRSLLTRLARSDNENADVWRRLPGFHWCAAVLRAQAGAEVLAVHDSLSTATGRLPLIVTKTFGTGKVLFMGTDSAWRWREGVEDTYHYRFWAQVARWMAYQRQMASGQSMRLFYSPDRPRTGDSVALNANVLDALGTPLSDATVVVQAIAPSGRTRTVRLQPGAADAVGLMSGTFVPDQPGTYKLIATCKETGGVVRADLSVQGFNRESQGRLARYDVLQEIAQVTGGKMVPVSQVRTLLDHLATLPEPEPVVHRTRIWAHPVWGGMLVLLLGVFWTGRKIMGAV